MIGFLWFVVYALFASVSVAGSTKAPKWGVTTLVLLLALRNAVMSGYMEGRSRYESALPKNGTASEINTSPEATR